MFFPDSVDEVIHELLDILVARCIVGLLFYLEFSRLVVAARQRIKLIRKTDCSEE
jgi:hypothetical protein